MAIGNIHLTPQLVEAVRDAVDILALASEHTRLRKAGRRYQGLCPIHREKSPSFSVDPAQGLFYCFGCGAGGDAIKLHMLVSGDDFPAAIEALALRHGIPLPTRGERSGSGKPERSLEGALEAAAAFFSEQLKKSSVARDYLEKRRIPEELIERFGLGYAPQGRMLIQSLHPRVPITELQAAGLVARSESGETYDRFRHRLMFPIHSPAGRLVGFGGRTLGDDRAKYINTSETERFHKGELLFGLHQAKREIREDGRAVLCEGYFDVLAAVAAGRIGAVAGMGTALTPEQAKLLSRYAESVVVAYDGDTAGETAHRRALPLLLAEGLAVYRARFPEGEDPDSLRLSGGEAALARALDEALDAVTLEIDRTIPPNASREPHLQAKAAAAIGELLRPIPDPILRFGYGRLAAERLDVPVEMLARRTGREPAANASAQPAQPKTQPAAPRERRLVRTLEEQVLEHLMRGEEALPSTADLPQAEVFLDPECRNIYQTFCTLYAEGGGPPPRGQAVLAALGTEGRAVDRMAMILLEGSFGPEKSAGLPESLDKLVRRWQEQRLKDLASAIRDAQRSGQEPAHLERLYDEKRRLSLVLHRGGVAPRSETGRAAR
jgi:DNA primase